MVIPTVSVSVRRHHLSCCSAKFEVVVQINDVQSRCSSVDKSTRSSASFTTMQTELKVRDHQTTMTQPSPPHTAVCARCHDAWFVMSCLFLDSLVLGIGFAPTHKTEEVAGIEEDENHISKTVMQRALGEDVAGSIEGHLTHFVLSKQTDTQYVIRVYR